MRLLAKGMDVYGADIQTGPPENIDLKKYFKLDITDPSNIQDVLRAVMPEMIFNLAGIFRGEASKIYNVNFLGCIYLLEAIRNWVPQAKVLLVGSAAEYGQVPEREMPIRETHKCNPYSPYGISKYAMTMAALCYAKDHDLKLVVARPFNIVGAGIPESLVVGAVLARIKKALNARKKLNAISVGNLDTERDFLAAEDAAEAFIKMILSDCWGEVFNVCSGKHYSIRSVLQLLADNSKQKIEFLEDATLIRATDVKCVYGSAEKSRKILEFKPKISLASALSAAWNEAIGGDA